MSLPSNPYPIPPVTVTSAGTPVKLTKNVPSTVDNVDLVASSIKFVGHPSNTGAVYFGRTGMNRTTRAGVIAECSPGEEKGIGANQANLIQPENILVDADNNNDIGYAVIEQN